ncbi:MAG: DMT family transporter [Ancalomicrobiaceae bacterium]|nr:DMT family transporter [Ancalomicrobiaceae bacterium]
MTVSTFDTLLDGRSLTVARQRLFGIGFICLAAMCFAALDSSAKWLGRSGLPVLEVAFIRYLGAFLVIAVVMNPWRTPSAWRTDKLWLQTLRSLALLGSTIFNFMALRTMQLADVMAINFVVPFLVALLAGPILGEKVAPRQWIAIALGFAGVLVVTRPGSNPIDAGLLWTLGGVLCNAYYAISTRQLSTVDSAASMLLISAGQATLLLAPSQVAIWVWPQSHLQWIAMGCIGVFATISHFFVIRAYTLAPAPVVAPFTYTQMIWTSLAGYILFTDVPGFYTVLGAAIVVASGLYLLVAEARQGNRIASRVMRD